MAQKASLEADEDSFWVYDEENYSWFQRRFQGRKMKRGFKGQRKGKGEGRKGSGQISSTTCRNTATTSRSDASTKSPLLRATPCTTPHSGRLGTRHWSLPRWRNSCERWARPLSLLPSGRKLTRILFRVRTFVPSALVRLMSSKRDLSMTSSWRNSSRISLDLLSRKSTSP